MGAPAPRTVTCRSWWTHPACGAASRFGSLVETTQIGPSILRLLGLNPRALQAVQIEHTKALPGLPGGWKHVRRPGTAGGGPSWLGPPPGSSA